MSHELICIKNILLVAMPAMWYIAMMTDLVTLCKFIEVKIRFTNSLKKKVEKAYYGKQKANCWKNILKHIREYEKDCHACDKLYKPKHTIVGDHCHETGKCTVSIHQNCNVNIL